MNVAILAGGKASRLGGIEKGMLDVCGKRVIERLLFTFHDCSTVIVCRDEEQAELYSEFASVTIDHYRNAGPLAGIHAALKHFRARILVVAADMPFVKRAVAEAIYDAGEKSGADAVIPAWSDGKTEPLLACYSFSAVEEIEKSLSSGERKIMVPVQRLERVIFYPVEKLKSLDERLVSFLNINTPEDLRRAEELCSSIDLDGE
ncbi:molybdenum cofactor guanylyltransferase [Archaeoglobus veneficus]|uniref:Probable molybdenum cofactor guanylyltransferase n=1 Tax=Archaeoglobus veneficus (strain DSM 11195 / SNP6) TaxID=693661 RepID=F2KP04_ARCVS|nr:molybdenum cofactor guanylyltransferase [Archaeoglobus veneficus]AEA46312.1 Molybdopterin-guanine dinucleotide biosynthesis protein A [Archaeoglobus veneficus SNP6]